RILLDRRTITAAALDRALAEQAERPFERLGETLVRIGACEEKALLEAVAEQVGVPFVDLDRRLVDRDVLDSVPAELRDRYSVLPMFLVGGALTLAMAEPTNVFAIEEVREATGAHV